MKILALDTATEGCSVSLGIGNRSIDRYVELERGHAEQLLPMVDSVLAEGGIALSALDAIAFGRGPGGFTGVRLAASVAQGLAFGAQVGVVPISDLAAVAQRVVQLNSSVRRVLVANDARMKEVYWATFEVDGAPRQVGNREAAPLSRDGPVPPAGWRPAGGSPSRPHWPSAAAKRVLFCMRTCFPGPMKFSRWRGRWSHGAKSCLRTKHCRFMSGIT
jgi:tRNA threonylcarbamoyladenosine biosynthesis protein TsaB